MPLLAEAWRGIAERPLGYIHSERLRLPIAMDTAQVQAVLNPLLVSCLQLDGNVPPLAERQGRAALWATHWQRLPEIAGLVAAWLLWPQLARGAHSCRLSAMQRSFAALPLGDRVADKSWMAVPAPIRLEAIGLHALTGWQKGLPALLGERLPLLFSPQAQACQRALAPVNVDYTLFLMAVQHARHNQKRD